MEDSLEREYLYQRCLVFNEKDVAVERVSYYFKVCVGCSSECHHVPRSLPYPTLLVSFDSYRLGYYYLPLRGYSNGANFQNVRKRCRPYVLIMSTTASRNVKQVTYPTSTTARYQKSFASVWQSTRSGPSDARARSLHLVSRLNSYPTGSKSTSWSKYTIYFDADSTHTGKTRGCAVEWLVMHLPYKTPDSNISRKVIR